MTIPLGHCWQQSTPKPVMVVLTEEIDGFEALVFASDEKLEMDCQVGHPAKNRAAEPRKHRLRLRPSRPLLKAAISDIRPVQWSSI